MMIKPLLILSAAVLAASMSASYAGPCSSEIDRAQAQVDAMVEVQAATGPSGRETVGAMTHRQPTPGSVAAAEEKLGNGASAERALAALARAREADRAADAKACESALADVRRILGP
jgi:hypothetical protein